MQTEDKIKIELDECEAEQFVQFRKYYQQFNRLREQGIFDDSFTGRVVLDCHRGIIKNLQRITNIHFSIRL
jgi:hypothetical protein